MSDMIDIIKSCSRCDGEHKNIEMKPFTKKVFLDSESGRVIATHFAICPTNQEPILILKTVYLSSDDETEKR